MVIILLNFQFSCLPLCAGGLKRIIIIIIIIIIKGQKCVKEGLPIKKGMAEVNRKYGT